MLQRIHWGVVVLLLCAALPVTAAGAQSDADPLAVAQTFLERLLAGDFDAATANFSPEMQQAGINAAQLGAIWQQLVQQVGAYVSAGEARIVEVEEPTVGFTVVMIPLTFEGAGLDMQVTVDQAGQIAGLFFRPSAQQPALAYEPPAYVNLDAFTEEDITLNAGTEWELPGSLTLPRGDGPFPAVVLVHGSGPNDRNETIGPNQPFRDLAWGLASQGIAVLRYDKRTLVYGQQMAALPGLTLEEETVQDALAAVKLLQGRPEIQSDGVFVLGHSLGATLAPRIAAQAPDLAGVILLAATARPLPAVAAEQLQYLAALDGEVTPQEQAMLDAAAAWVAAIDSYQAGDPTPQPPIPELAAPMSYWLDLRDYDPLAAAQALDLPMLILQGERDYQVTMTDFELWQQALAGRANVTLKSYPALNHLFIAGEGPASPEEYAKAGHVDQSVVDDIAKWVLAQTAS